ncbi:MAG: hypothetical protein KC931_26700, partial [Candidatus Omnitrophica bacterium]|nr:hypothetical protein [Candidatus Omnitrophota bacterium]
SETHKVGPEGVVFSIEPLPITGLEFEWFLDREKLPEASQPEVKLFSNDVTVAAQELVLVVSFPTPFIRKEKIEASFTWTVQSTGEEVPTATPSPTQTPAITEPTATPDYDFNDDTRIDAIDALTLIPTIRSEFLDDSALFDFSLQWEK